MVEIRFRRTHQIAKLTVRVWEGGTNNVKRQSISRLLKKSSVDVMSAIILEILDTALACIMCLCCNCCATDSFIDESLQIFAHNGYHTACRFLCRRLSPGLREKYAADHRPDNSSSPLIVAVKNNQLAVVRFFVEECNFNVNQIHNKFATALHNARDSELCRLLLENGADPNLYCDIGSTVINHAIYYENASIIRLLLDYGADPNVDCRIEQDGGHDDDNYHHRTIEYAINVGNVEIVRMLLHHGACVRRRLNPITSM
jgi:Ankyrin repeats (3 copies)